jgi:ADP-heptose:LPS heptosyltransferase
MARDNERARAWAQARNVLCVRLDNLGDVLMTTPAIRALRAATPDRRITLLASRAGVEVAPLVPDIDAAIRYDAPWMKSTESARVAYDLEMRERLAAEHFDAAVIFTVYSQSALPAAMLCHLAEIPLDCRDRARGRRAP